VKRVLTARTRSTSIIAGFPLFAAALGGCGRAASIAPIASTAPEVSIADLRTRLYLISDDSMMGRESGSEGDYKTAAYVAAEFHRLGLEPAGENGTYFQTVPFWRAAVDARSHLTAGSVALDDHRDFIPANIGAQDRRFDNTPTVYGGSTADTSRVITADQAAGKVVIFDIPPGTPGRGVPMAASWSRATAIALVNLDQTGAEAVARLREGRPIPDTTRNPRALPVILISRHAAAVILGADPASLSPGAPGSPLSGSIDIARSPVPFPARNVIAVLRGSDPALRGEYVALTAHNDHVGFDHSPVDHDSLRAFNRVIRPMGADSPPRTPTSEEAVRIRAILDSARRVRPPRLDSIRNGADDDGSGTVSILEIAEAMARGGARPRRSILFVSHTGEETGLLGSKWFTDHPTVPLDSVVAEIDQDMVGRGTSSDFPRGGTGAGSPTYLEVVGAKRLSREFGEMVESANARQPVPFQFDYSYDSPHHPLQYYCRADHYSYARYGIPSLALSRGEHLDYHQVSDEAQYISYPDLARVSHLVYDAAMLIANSPTRPRLDAPKAADPHAPCRQ
jgi:hypothetical protein